MKATDEVWDLVNLRNMSAGFLATADRAGNVDVAVYGSFQLSDRETATMMMGDTRSLSNLKENPQAAFIVASGESLGDIRGCRLYLEVQSIVEEGPVVETGRKLVSEAVNEQVASLMKAFITFDVRGIRPLVDVGLGA